MDSQPERPYCSIYYNRPHPPYFCWQLRRFQTSWDGISELRIDYGPGFRVYFTQRGQEVVILLCGGDKSTQGRDIETAKLIARNIEGET